MSKGTKILILVVLMFASSSLFGMAQKSGNAQVSALFAFLTVGLLVGVFVVALSRDERRRR